MSDNLTQNISIPCRSTEFTRSSLLAAYSEYLHNQERSLNTIAKYIRDLEQFFTFLNGRSVSKEAFLDWKNHLSEKLAPTSINSMLAAVNSFLDWQGTPQYKIKYLKIQRAIFSNPEKELTHQEYCRLVQAAERLNNRRLALLLQTICSTGIRVSELRYITLEAVNLSRASVDCKGKKRTVFLPRKLCAALRLFCKEQNIKNGIIFRSRTGTPLNRSNIWRDLKSLCAAAGVSREKVFPHNLRHLFARTYYRMEKDLSRLADILGHCSLSTTRIYTMESGIEHAKHMDKLNLVFSHP